MDNGAFSKDLTVINPDLSRIFILDNSPGAYRGHPRKLFITLYRIEIYNSNTELNSSANVLSYIFLHGAFGIH